MIEFGKTLREAREAKGYTINQIAEMTRMMAVTIQSLENEDFSKIPAPIYGRGFVKLYCEAIGIDPKPLITEYMEIHNGNREPNIRSRTVAAAEIPSKAPVVATEPPPPPKKMQLSEKEPANVFKLESEVIPSTVHTPPATANGEATFSRYATPLQDRNEGIKHARIHLAIPPAIWRMALLAMVVIVVLWLAFMGLKALHQATSTPKPNDTQAEVSETPIATPGKPAKPTENVKPVKPTENAKPAAKRKPQEIPPLYIN